MLALLASSSLLGTHNQVPQIRVHIDYVDGTEAEEPASGWSRVRSDGVDKVTLKFPDGTQSIWQGRSLYWLYREDDHWVIGMSTFTYSPKQVPEVLFWSDGRQELRKWENVPDLRHEDVKLGWWWIDD
jgi:hypothetical protein